MNTFESNAIEELERLATMRAKIRFQNTTIDGAAYRSREPVDTPEVELDGGRIFDKIIGSKTDFIKKCSLSRLTSGGGVEPMAALERLTEVAKKVDSSQAMADLLKSTILEVCLKPRPKVSLRHDLSSGDSFIKP